jgi:hypothetical protein
MPKWQGRAIRRNLKKLMEQRVSAAVAQEPELDPNESAHDEFLTQFDAAGVLGGSPF